MNTFKPLNEQSTWEDAYNNINNLNNSLSGTDFLYKSELGNGQLFKEDGTTGYVNEQEAKRMKNITITKDYSSSFKITNFVFYNRLENKLINVDIDCNLYNYRDNRPHFLYIVLSDKGKYEVYDDIYQSDNTRVLFARFILDSEGNAIQFYVIAPFAGSPDYIKGNQYYEVSEGFNLIYFDKDSKQFTVSNSKIRFSGINFDDQSSPDVLHIVQGDINTKFRYITWDTVNEIPIVDWKSELVDTPIINKTMDYSTGALGDIPENYFSNQKIYYDIYSKVFIAMYGKSYYETMEEAVSSMEEILSYPKPDGIDYLLPIAVLTIKNTSEAYNNDNIRIVGLKFDENELFDSNDLARQQSLEAVMKAEQAIDKAEQANTNLSNHIGNKSNPHSVTASQVGLGNVKNYNIASQSEAQVATSNTSYMTPMRTLDTINAKSIITDGNIILKLSPSKPTPQAGKTIIWIDTSS